MYKKTLIGSITVIIGVLALIRFGYLSPNQILFSLSPSPNQNLIVDSPKPNSAVSNPIRVTGKGMAFESTFSYRLKDKNGKILYENNAMLKDFNYPQYGTFDLKIAIPLGVTDDLTLEVFEYSAKDGAVTNLVRVPLTLEGQATTALKAYFLNNALDPQQTCVQVFPVERVVPTTKEVAFVALSETLRGPTPADTKAGYTTAIPPRVAINSIVISGDTVKVDFNYALDSGIGGSCRVSAIRAQITQTLKQFSNIKQVIISREGNTEEALQP